MHRHCVLTFGMVIGICLITLSGLGGCPGSPGGGGGSAFNLPPTPIITSDVVRGVAPLLIQFSSDRSTDDGLIVSREWDFGDGGTSLDISPKHTYTGTGDFTVTLKLTDNSGVSNTDTIVISVTDAPIAVMQFSPTTAEAAPAVVSFTAAASRDPDGEIVEYRWDFGDGSREFQEEVTHVFTSAGTFRVKLTVTDNKGVTGATEQLIPVGIPTPTIEVRTPPQDLKQLIVPQNAPLWIQAVYEADDSAASFIRAGLDRDMDQCEGKAFVYDMTTGEEIYELTGHADRVNDVAYSPDGAFIATASDDGTVRLYNSEGDWTATYDRGSAVNAVAFAPNSKRLAVGTNDGIVSLALVNVNGADVTVTHDKTLAGHTASVESVAFSPDGTRLLSGSADRHALLWNIADRTILRDLNHNLGINAVAYSAGDDSMIATGSEDGTIKIWNIDSGGELLTLAGHAAAVNDLSFSSGGLTLISAGDDNAVRIWNPFLGILVARYDGHEGDATAVAISDDGATIVSGGADYTARTWNTTTAQQLLYLQPCSSTVSSVDVSPDGKYFVAGIAARNDILLDTDPPNGGDLNITYPQALRLQNVEDIDDADVPTGRYYLWAEVATDQTDRPSRVYASPEIYVTNDFTTDLTTAPPIIRTGNEDDVFEASVLVSDTQNRQIFDLGPLTRGDRIYVSLMNTPGYGEYFTPANEFSVMIIDSQRKIFAWYSSLLTNSLLDPIPELSDFVLFNKETKLVAGHYSSHYYVVVDGGASLNVRIEPDFDPTPDPVQQRIYVNFEGGPAVAAGGQPPRVIPALDAADFNVYHTSPDWDDTDTAQLKNTIMQKLRAVYSDFNVDPASANDSNGVKFYSSANYDPEDVPLPYSTIYVGGYTPDQYLGIADYVDPRNQTTTGSAIVYATQIAAYGLSGTFAMPMSAADTTDLGNAIGVIAANMAGKLMGLRNTEDNDDIMEGAAIYLIGDPTTARRLKEDASLPPSEQVGNLNPLVGVTQDAVQLLRETIGEP